MRQFTREFVHGLLLAVPVLIGAGFGARELLHLRQENEELEAGRLEAVRGRDAAEEKLATVLRTHDQSLADRLRAAADAAETQGEAQQRLTGVIEFLKKEVSTAEATIDGMKRDPATAGAANPERTAQLLREIGRLNKEIESLRGELEQLKKRQ